MTRLRTCVYSPLLPLVVACAMPASADAAGPVVGANLDNEPYRQTPAEQGATFPALQSAGVKVIRAGIPDSDQGLAFAERAWAHGIKIEWLMGVDWRSRRCSLCAAIFPTETRRLSAAGIFDRR